MFPIPRTLYAALWPSAAVAQLESNADCSKIEVEDNQDEEERQVDHKAQERQVGCSQESGTRAGGREQACGSKAPRNPEASGRNSDRNRGCRTSRCKSGPKPCGNRGSCRDAVRRSAKTVLPPPMVEAFGQARGRAPLGQPFPKRRGRDTST